MPAIIPTFSNNIPLPGDQPSNSQPRLRDNFDGINQIWDLNHFSFNDANAGKHKFCQFIDQTATGAPVTGAAPAEFALYNFDYNAGAGVVNELVIKKPNTGQRIPFTSKGGTSTNGWSWLASGLLMKWGFYNFTVGAPDPTPNPVPNTPRTITYPPAGVPAFNAAAHSIMITSSSSSYGGAVDPNFYIYLNSNGTALNFTVKVFRRISTNTASFSVNFNWLAIGPATSGI